MTVAEAAGVSSRCSAEAGDSRSSRSRRCQWQQASAAVPCAGGRKSWEFFKGVCRHARCGMDALQHAAPPVHSQPSIPSQCRPYPSIPSQPPTPTHQPHTQLCRLPPPPTPHTSQPEHTPTTTTTMTSRQTPQQTSHHNKLHNKQEENSDTKLTVNSYCLSSTASIRSTKAVT